MRLTPVLFARSDSNYLDFPSADIWDVNRNALNYTGTVPVIAHPPCALWGRMRQFATRDISQKELAILSVSIVRRWGGVIEHPAYSKLWDECELPRPGQGYDSCGGWTMAINQFCFGHLAEKKTWLYIVGCSPGDIPTYPYSLDYPSHCIRPAKGDSSLQIISKAAREHTPVALCAWLLTLVNRIPVRS